MSKDIIYTLSIPVEYAHAGELVSGSFITLLPPTSRNMNECAELKQAFFRSLPKTGDMEVEVDEGTEAEITGEAIMTMIMMSNEVKFSSVLVIGRELLASGVAMIDGEEKLTKPLIDKLSTDDLEGMIGEYMANFILASALRKLRKN